MAQLRPGLKLTSAACSAEVMVIKAPGEVDLTCGGLPMTAPDGTPATGEANSELMAGCQIGKRYVNEDQSLELLCVKAGEGTLAIDGEPLAIKDAKKLPSSD
ncbi:MAG TPA: hypothetical protein VJ998_09220 [Pseudomonadales bacterium]|nr:hypothetical protein [Pseudomonadales bacterium]